MKDISERFERLKDFLWKMPLVFCVVYRVNRTWLGARLKWCRAVSPCARGHEAHDRIATMYHRLATHCCRSARDMVIEERRLDGKTRPTRRFGLPLLDEPKGDLPPANVLGQRWWHLVVATGATRDAGYVIVARVAARDREEVHARIATIQQIMATPG